MTLRVSIKRIEFLAHYLMSEEDHVASKLREDYRKLKALQTMSTRKSLAQRLIHLEQEDEEVAKEGSDEAVRFPMPSFIGHGHFPPSPQFH